MEVAQSFQDRSGLGTGALAISPRVSPPQAAAVQEVGLEDTLP